MKFCRRFSIKYGVNSRLTFETEWEYACREGTETECYWWKKANGDFAWYRANSKMTHPVWQKRANGYFLYDMTGNVWE